MPRESMSGPARPGTMRSYAWTKEGCFLTMTLSRFWYSSLRNRALCARIQ